MNTSTSAGTDSLALHITYLTGAVLIIFIVYEFWKNRIGFLFGILWKYLPFSSHLQKHVHPISEQISGVAACNNPSCVRCRNFLYEYTYLSARLKQYEEENNYVLNLDRIKSSLLISSKSEYAGFLSDKSEFNGTVVDDSHIKRGTREGGHSREEVVQNPTVLKVPNLTARAWYPSKNLFAKLDRDLFLLESSRVITQLSKEFDFVSADSDGWIINSTHAGCWKMFYLYNQGVPVQQNCSRCPETFDVINQLDNFMAGVVFGNAFFSVIYPGTQIDKHTGPTNARIRCHVVLSTDPKCSLTVASEELYWPTSGTLFFDDSFPHSVRHQGSKLRSVLIIDFWHPELTKEEQNCLSFLYAV